MSDTGQPGEATRGRPVHPTPHPAAPARVPSPVSRGRLPARDNPGSVLEIPPPPPTLELPEAAFSPDSC
jgi:hypothetical protein